MKTIVCLRYSLFIWALYDYNIQFLINPVAKMNVKAVIITIVFFFFKFCVINFRDI